MSAVTAYPHRRVFMVGEGSLAIAGFAGAVQLMTGVATPPVSDLEPLGFTTWVLPGIWLGASVGLPSAAAAYLAWRRSPHAPNAVLLSSGLLAVELAVQIPFIGPSLLQGVFGTVALTMGGIALDARRRGWRSTPR
ncbi:MAG: hypothetical protein ACOYD0_00035 [Candidatus Nanopelagicales bacterium]